MVFGLSKNSYYQEEQKRIRDSIKGPLLELVLWHLPHLQPSESAQQDSWEMIAIKLNNRNFDLSVGTDHQDEMPTLNGGFIKGIYDDLMKKFVGNIRYVNSSAGVYSTPRVCNNRDPLYETLYFPIRGTYKDKCNQILCELFYLDSAGIEIMAQLSKERLEKEYRHLQHSINEPTPLDEKTKTRSYSDSKNQLDQLKEKLELDKLKRYQEELEKKAKRVEFLDNENKRLLELNHELVLQLRGSDH